MLTALLPDGRAVPARAWDGQAQAICPECAHPVVAKRGRVKTPHFAHQPGATCPHGVGESAEHLAMKDALLRWFPSARAEVRLVPGRRADVVVDVCGQPVVIECQASPISIEAWEERTLDYTRHGIPVQVRRPHAAHL